MTAIRIRDVAPDTVDALKRLARSNHRSLQGELRTILQRAARMAPPEQGAAKLNLVTVRVGGSASWRREEIYGAEGR